MTVHHTVSAGRNCRAQGRQFFRLASRSPQASTTNNCGKYGRKFLLPRRPHQPLHASHDNDRGGQQTCIGSRVQRSEIFIGRHVNVEAGPSFRVGF